MKPKIRFFKILSLVLVLALSFALAGCSNSSGTSANGGGKGNVTTITLWYGATGTSGDAIKAAVDNWNKTHKSIQVKAVYTASTSTSDDKLLTAIAGGTGPDVAYFDRFKVGSWANQGSLTDLTSFAQKDGISKSMFYPYAWDEANFKGKLYAMPLTTDSRMMFYNKDLFKKAGITSVPKTIAQLETDAQKLTIKDGNKFKQIGFIPWYAQGELYTWGFVFGGSFYNKSTGKVTAADPHIVKALQWEADWAKKYNVQDITSFTNSQGSDAMDPFLTGQIAMKVDGPWILPSIKQFNPNLNYGVFPIPTPTGTNFTTWSGGMSLVMPKGAKHPDAAWKFMKYFTVGAGAKTYSKISGDFSCMPSLNKELGYTTDPILSKFTKILPNSHNRPVIPEGQLYWNETIDAVDKAIHGNGTPKQILQAVDNKVNAALEKDRQGN